MTSMCQWFKASQALNGCTYHLLRRTILTPSTTAPPATTPATPIAMARMATTYFIWASLQRLRYVVPVAVHSATH
jgi:hypothetical protein